MEAAFDSCPQGFVSLLARLGDSPVSPDPRIYRLAWSLYADPRHRDRVKLLMQTEGTIAASKILVVSHLDGLLLRRSVLDRISTPAEVQRLQEAVRLIKSLVPDATDDRLAQSLDGLGPLDTSRRLQVGRLSAWVLGWLAKAERCPDQGPLPHDDPDFRLLGGRDLAEVGRRYRNCLGQYVGHIAAGRRVFYEWTRDPGAVIELHCLHDGTGRTYYTVGQIRGRRNARLLSHDLDVIRARLSQHGILFAGAPVGSGTSMSTLLQVYDDADGFAGLLDNLGMEVEGQVMVAV
jgi:hypothetical protein